MVSSPIIVVTLENNSKFRKPVIHWALFIYLYQKDKNLKYNLSNAYKSLICAKMASSADKSDKFHLSLSGMGTYIMFNY